MTWAFYDTAGNLKTSNSGASNLADLLDVDTTAGLVDGSLLRYEAASSEWLNTLNTTLVLSDAGQLQVPTTGSAGGLLLGGDTNLYRSAANVLATDDTFQTSTLQSTGAMVFNTQTTDQVLRLVGAIGFSDSVNAAFVQVGDATDKHGMITAASAAILDRLAISAVGVVFSDDTHTSIQPPVPLVNLEGTGAAEGITFGSDQASPANLYRSAANLLATDDEFSITIAGGKDTLRLTSTGTDTGITIGGDTNLYRSAANILTTDDSLTVTGELIVGSFDSRSLSAGATLAATDHIVFLLTTTAAGAFTVTLPTAVGRDGKVYTFIDSEGNAHNKNVTIDGAGAETIDGAATYVMNIPREQLTVVSNGTAWFGM